MLITAGERKATALLCMALHDLGVPADSFTGSQAGFITDSTHTNAKIVELRPERLVAALRRRAARRSSAARRACPATATSPSSAAAAPTPPRSRSPTPSAPTRASSTPTCPACSSADPRLVPDARRMAHGELRRDARDDRVRLPEAGHAVGRVRPHLGRAPAHPISVHLGARHLGAGGGSVHGAGHRLGRRARHVGGQGHRRPACPTSPASPPGCSGSSPTPTSTST